MSPRQPFAATAVAVATVALMIAAAAPAALAKTAKATPGHPYEAIAGHYPTMQQANAVAAQAKAKGFKAVVQPNRPGHIEVEYGNGWTTPGPAQALCQKVKASGLPCTIGVEQHGVPKEWAQP
jgi:hypothetical protein